MGEIMERRVSTFGVIAARTNCPPDWGMKEKCPKCGYFHLRPGYCQALNPEASAAIASGRPISMKEARRLASLPLAVSVDTKAVDKADVDTPPVDKIDKTVDERRAYQREWLRKKRLEKEKG